MCVVVWCVVIKNSVFFSVASIIIVIVSIYCVLVDRLFFQLFFL